MSQIKFTPKPSPVLPDHRNIYKISQILLILWLSSRGGKANLPKLQLFNWALKNKERKQALLKASQDKLLNFMAWGFDPALTIALKFAEAEGLIIVASGGYQLTDFGQIFVNQILNDETILVSEKAILMQVGKAITETMVDKITKSWTK